MKIKIKPQNQKQLWNSIAEEWNTYKEIPSGLSQDFLKNECCGKVLDLGSGSGRHLTKIKNGKMYLVDFSENMIKLAEKKANKLKIPAEFIVADISNKLPFENNFFDCALSVSALHCLPPKGHKVAIKELYRVLKSKGKALIGVWNYNSKRFKSKKNKGKERLIGWTDKGKRYYYLFEENEIHNLFKKAGFKILSSHNSEMMINFIVKK
jgi:ubiquinone/menaquinone biosynthesis C-methylase UbiE